MGQKMCDKENCLICNQGYSCLNNVYNHVKSVHNISKIDYQKDYLKHTIECHDCGELFSNDKKLNKHRNVVHNTESPYSIANDKRNQRLEENSIDCQVCGDKLLSTCGLSIHLTHQHPEVDKAEYCVKYLNPENPSGKCLHCGEKLPFRGFGKGEMFAKFCSFSCSTTWYAENTDRIDRAMSTMKKREDEDPDFRLGPNNQKYWINKGFTELEAIELVKERQSTFNLEKCIAKHGEIEGTKVFQARQDKWQKTLNDKSPEEKERILKAKMTGGNGLGYSMISQKLFHSVHALIKDIIGDKKVYYAENLTNGNNHHENGEYVEFLPSGKYYLYDFYIPSINFVMEFDGDYWHSEEREGSLERDALREAAILSSRPELEIIHIKECDYRQDPTAVIDYILYTIKGLLSDVG